MALLLRNIKFQYVARRTIITSSKLMDKHFHLVVAGGGIGGMAVANRFFFTDDTLHYYQPLWTLVGAGIKPFEESFYPIEKKLFPKVQRIKDPVAEFDPDNNKLTLKSGEKLTYQYLVVALGIQLRYDLIPGAIEALENDDKVVSNYSKDYVKKTFKAFENFTGGTALFSFPNTPVKCAGAPQKVMYLFDDYLRQHNLREKANIQYFTSLPAVFSVPKYSEKLQAICDKRDLKVTTRSHLLKVDHSNRIATFENIDTKNKTDIKYDFLHITPPMAAYNVIKSSKLSDANGFVDVDKENMQHVKYPNVFALGDCCNVPTSKTAAAAAAQHDVLSTNLYNMMLGKSPRVKKYDGYTSCPFLTDYEKGILAEFGYDGKILETFPYDQSKESQFVYFLKLKILPHIYWKMIILGGVTGRKFFRRIFKIFKSE